jgi:small nuclear ribonucleoprotein (snRNP)-like protein
MPPPRKPDPLNKTLCCVLQALLTLRISVELRSEAEVRGTLTSLDAQMNCILVDCTVKNVQKRVERVERMFIAGRSIRCVHIPDDIDITAALAERIFRADEASALYRRRMLPPSTASAIANPPAPPPPTHSQPLVFPAQAFLPAGS